jgi:ADP-ribosylglycohydrolase
VPYEFHPPEALPASDAIEMEPPPGFERAHARVPPGTWSDDGAHALCLAESLLACDRLDLEDFAKRLVAWYREGAYAVGGIVFDVGIQTESAIHRLIDGAPARTAGASDEMANGNGSLMRVLPLALWHQGTDASLVRDAHEQSLVTHGHPRAQVCCALYCLWARCEIEGAKLPWESAVTRLRGIYSGEYAAHEAELVEKVVPGFAHPRGTGYVVDCLHSARFACESKSYEAIVQSAIALGRDTDTTACVAGGIAGIRYGRSGIPDRWLTRLRGQDLVEPLLARLRVAHAARSFAQKA